MEKQIGNVLAIKYVYTYFVFIGAFYWNEIIYELGNQTAIIEPCNDSTHV